MVIFRQAQGHIVRSWCCNNPSTVTYQADIYHHNPQKEKNRSSKRKGLLHAMVLSSDEKNCDAVIVAISRPFSMYFSHCYFCPPPKGRSIALFLWNKGVISKKRRGRKTKSHLYCSVRDRFEKLIWQFQHVVNPVLCSAAPIRLMDGSFLSYPTHQGVGEREY